MVVPVPSVMESPKATMTWAFGGQVHVDFVEEVPGGRRIGNALSLTSCCRERRAGRRQVGRLQRLGVPGHRAAVAHDMEADGELQSLAASGWAAS